MLSRHGITAVADVRSRPFSRFSPQFNKEPLRVALAQCGIHYVFLGVELGARSTNDRCYRDGRVQYELLASTPLFQEGISRLISGMDTNTIAIMCTEKEPLECHRAILIARYLEGHGIRVIHIHDDGHLEPHSDAIRRLAATLPLRGREGHLFRSDEDLWEDAYKLQEAKIAYQGDAKSIYIDDKSPS